MRRRRCHQARRDDRRPEPRLQHAGGGRDRRRAGDAVGSTPSQPGTLTSFDDWARVTPGLMGFTNGFGTGSGDLDQEPDAEELEAARLSLSGRPRPASCSTRPARPPASPVTSLTYVANVTNTGRGPALSAVLTQTSPDATAHVTEPGTIAVGTQVMRHHDVHGAGRRLPGIISRAPRRRWRSRISPACRSWRPMPWPCRFSTWPRHPLR